MAGSPPKNLNSAETANGSSISTIPTTLASNSWNSLPRRNLAAPNSPPLTPNHDQSTAHLSCLSLAPRHSPLATLYPHSRLSTVLSFLYDSSTSTTPTHHWHRFRPPLRHGPPRLPRLLFKDSRLRLRYFHLPWS